MRQFDLQWDVFLAFDFDNLINDSELTPLTINQVVCLVFIELLLPEITVVYDSSSDAIGYVVRPSKAQSWHTNQ